MQHLTTSILAKVGITCTKRTLTTSTKHLHADIPESRGLPLIGNLLTLWRAGGAPHLHHYIDQQHRKYGPVFKENLGGNVRAVFISDPEVMRAVFAKEGKHPVHVLPEAWTVYNELYGCARGLFFMNGPEWLHYRRIMNNFLLKPSITSNQSSSIKEAVEIAAGSLNLQNWEKNLEEALYLWSLDTIVAVMLGKQQYKTKHQEIDEKLKDCARKIKLIFETSSKLQFLPIKLAVRFKLSVWNDFVHAVDDALFTASELVYELMTISQIATAGVQDQGVITLMQRAQMAPSDIIKIVVDLVLAAGDTTAYTMQWILYSLAMNPQYQAVFETNDIKNYVKETLRLYPVAPFLTRINTEQDFVVGKYYIPKNTLLIYSLYTVGRDVKYFDEPEQFLPERWQNKTPQMTQASLPFAIGGRSCIGRRIAEFQLTTTLQNVLKNYTIKLTKPKENIDTVLKMITVPSKSINLKFTAKTNTKEFN